MTGLENLDISRESEGKRVKKKGLVIILTMAVLASLTGCGNKNATDTGNTNTVNNQSDSSDESSKTDSSVSTDRKVLVAYFAVAENSDVDAVSSAPAEMIQEKTGGELFSIKTSVKYPGDGGKLIDYAQEEQDKDERPELTTHIDNLDDYNVIFVGFPTWWYDLPQVLYSFFDEYDFSGKTIIPFNSHNGSQFSGTIETIQKLEPDATVITDGFTVNERDVPDAKNDIDEWLSDLGY